MKISVILPTYRTNTKEELQNLIDIAHKSISGSFSEEFSNLCEWYMVPSDEDTITHILEPTLMSLMCQKFKDFEVILCHKHPEDVKELVDRFKKFIDIKVIKEKDSIWHKLGDYPTVNNIRNTGIMEAKGELLYFLDDMCIFGDTLLEQVWKNYEEGYYTTNKTVKRIKIENDKIVGSPKLKLIDDGLMISNSITWSYGMSVSREECLEINGFDELYDGSFGGTDIDFGRRLKQISTYRRRCGQTIYEFAHYVNKMQNKMVRDDEMFRQIIKQSPIPKNIRANLWKPTKNEIKRYEIWHKKNVGDLNPHWNKFMDVKLYDMKI